MMGCSADMVELSYRTMPKATITFVAPCYGVRWQFGWQRDDMSKQAVPDDDNLAGLLQSQIDLHQSNLASMKKRREQNAKAVARLEAEYKGLEATLQRIDDPAMPLRQELEARKKDGRRQLNNSSRPKVSITGKIRS